MSFHEFIDGYPKTLSFFGRSEPEGEISRRSLGGIGGCVCDRMGDMDMGRLSGPDAGWAVSRFGGE